MKSRLFFFLSTLYFSFSRAFCSFARADGRIDKALFEAILIFLQSCSYFLWAIGIGMFIYSIKETDGGKKTDSLKVIGVGLLLFSLKKIAQVGGLI